MIDRALQRWARARPHERAQVYLTLAATVLFLVHFASYSGWFIEDAAISFAYARHAAEGHGFVSYVGGEPVEGFSNPTWTLAMAGLHVVGVDPWVSAKLMGAMAGALGLPLAAAWAARVLGGRGDALAGLAPVWLALSPQYVTWAASGLENSFVTLGMAAGAALLLGEVERPGRWPWSALAFSFLAVTRPEAPAFAGIAALVGLVSLALAHGPGAAWAWAWRWALTVSGPLLAWNLWRFWMFAWEAPNTYFAKLQDADRFRPWEWSGKRARGWNYVRAWALHHGQGFLLPFYVFTLVGPWGARARLALALVVAWLVLLVPGIGWLHSLWGPAPLEAYAPAALGAKGVLPLWPFAPDPAWWSAARIIGLAGLAGLAPIFGYGRPGQPGRWLAAWFVAFSIFFAVYAGGDWMEGYRWMNLAIVPLAVLLTDAVATIYDLARRLPAFPRVLLAGLPLAATAVLSVVWTVDHIGTPETSPYDVGRRVYYMQKVGERLGLDHAVWMDVDMGAHLWWAGERDEIVDMAGLIDVPMGHHKWELPFVKEYVFQERKPDFAHVHGSWATKTRMRSHREWADYLEIDPYPISPRKVHVGNHVRRDLLFVPEGTGSPDGTRGIDFTAPISLAGWNTPAPTVAAGHPLVVEVYLRRTGNTGAARPILFLAGHGHVWAIDVPPAYDQVPLTAWRRDEEAKVLVRLPVPADSPFGSYDLGFVWLTPEGAAAPPTPTPSPRLHRQEVRWEAAIQVVPESEAAGLVAQAAQATGDCDARAASWRAGRHALGPDHPARAAAQRTVDVALARCHAAQVQTGVQGGLTRAEVVRHGRLANRHGRYDAEVRPILDETARQWRARSREAEAAGDLDGAWSWSVGSLALDPAHAWERRRAERLRDQRLKLVRDPVLSESVRQVLGW